MLDLVLARRRGLPILLSVVYTEVARGALQASGAVVDGAPATSRTRRATSADHGARCTLRLSRAPDIARFDECASREPR